MKRPLHLALAAALVAGTMAVGTAPAAAQGVGVTFGVGNWDNDRWHYDNNGWGDRHYRHHHRHHVAPGYYMNFGIPHPQARAYYHPHRYYRTRDCWSEGDGDIICHN